MDIFLAFHLPAIASRSIRPELMAEGRRGGRGWKPKISIAFGEKIYLS